MGGKLTTDTLQRMKREAKKIVAVVAWDHQIAQIVDRAGVDLVSVGDSVGVNLWGDDSPLETTLDQMVLVGRAVRRGVQHALVSCDFPYGPLQAGARTALLAAQRLVQDAGVDMVKLDGAAEHPEAVEAIAGAGISVFAQFGISPQTAPKYGLQPSAVAFAPTEVPEALTLDFVADARRLVDAGATLLDFTNSGPVVGPAVVEAVEIPVLGGMGGGPWLDGRIRMVHAAIGYPASAIDTTDDRYADVARITLGAIQAYAEDVRAGRQIKGGSPR